VWDAATTKFYMSIPKTAANANGEIEEIKPGDDGDYFAKWG
jgi:hypothetical protein